MTAQIAEILHYNGQELAICSEPLGDYFALGGHRPDFTSGTTALWRGYRGTWEIHNNRLYLVGLRGTLENGREATLATVFPGYPDRVFAHWYSGRIRVPLGKLLEYVHAMYASVYERDLFLTVRKGVVAETLVRENGTGDNENAPDGYGVAAMTIFPGRNKSEKEKPA